MGRLPVFLLAATGLLLAQPQPKTIAYLRVGPSQIQVFVSNADGTAERPLLDSDSLDYNPAWSPDGQWIVFTSERNGAADLYRAKPDGTGLQRLTTNRAYEDQADVSPDGQKLAFVSTRADGTADLWIRDIGTNRETPLTSGLSGDFRPAWSPDGKWIAFSSDRGTTVQRDGGGQWWVHLQLADIYIIRPDGSALNKLTNSGNGGNFCGGPRWTRDGSHVIGYCMSGEETFAYRPQSELTDEALRRMGRAPVRGNTTLVSIDVATREQTTIAAPPGIKFYPAVLNDGEIAYRKDGDVADTLFQQEGKLTQSADWSPQGDAILFGLGQYFRNRAQGAQVAMIKPDGSGLREVTSGANNNGFPSYAPDGKRFVYRTFGPEGQGLRIMNLEGGHLTMLTEDYDNFPRWSPRGDVITFVRRLEGSFVIFSIAPDGTHLKRLTGPGSDDSHATWSPDGEWVAFSSARMGFKDEALNTDSPQPYGEIFVMRYDGTRVEQLTDNQWEEGTPAWLPSSRTTPQ